MYCDCCEHVGGHVCFVYNKDTHTHKLEHSNIFCFKGLPGFTPFIIWGVCTQGHFLIVPPPMEFQIQWLSVSLCSDNSKCQNVQCICLEMSPKVVCASGRSSADANMNIQQNQTEHMKSCLKTRLDADKVYADAKL